jgi:hypothetical protein
LNSNEYLKSFLNDSLRRARALIDDLRATLASTPVQELDRELAELKQARDRAVKKTEALARLRQIEWRDNVQELTPWLVGHIGELAAQVKTETAGAVETAVQQWFDSPNSLHHLLDQDLLPVFATAQTRLVRAAEDAIKRRASEGLVGLPSIENLQSDLKDNGLDLRAIAEGALVHLKDHAAVASPRPRLSGDEIPVRRSFSDWLMFRSGTKVRRRLFGPAEQPDTTVPPAMKMRALGDAGRDAIRDAMLSQLAWLLDGTANDLPDQLVRGYSERFEQDLKVQLEQVHAAATERLEELEKRLGEVQKAHTSLNGLSGKLGSFTSSVDVLTEAFRQTAAATLTDPATGELTDSRELTDSAQ